MDELLHAIQNNGCNYSSLPWYNLNRVSKLGPWAWCMSDYIPIKVWDVVSHTYLDFNCGNANRSYESWRVWQLSVNWCRGTSLAPGHQQSLCTHLDLSKSLDMKGVHVIWASTQRMAFCIFSAMISTPPFCYDTCTQICILYLHTCIGNQNIKTLLILVITLQYYGCWCPDSLRRQVISNHGIWKCRIKAFLCEGGFPLSTSFCYWKIIENENIFLCVGGTSEKFAYTSFKPQPWSRTWPPHTWCKQDNITGIWYHADACASTEKKFFPTCFQTQSLHIVQFNHVMPENVLTYIYIYTYTYIYILYIYIIYIWYVVLITCMGKISKKDGWSFWKNKSTHISIMKHRWMVVHIVHFTTLCQKMSGYIYIYVYIYIHIHIYIYTYIYMYIIYMISAANHLHG